LPLLAVAADRALAEQALPRAPGGPNGERCRRRPLSIAHGYLLSLSWAELLHRLQVTAQRHFDDMSPTDNPFGREAWAYFLQVCSALSVAHLRGDTGRPCSNGLVLGGRLASLHLGHLCRRGTAAACWAEVMRRLGRHSLLLVRVKATPCLADEVRQVTSLVPGSAVCSLTSVGSRLEDLASSAEVLYVAGRHARELGAALERCCLVGIGLAVLNICRSEVVGRRLLTKGVQHVVCWPSEVHDSEAAAFGTRLVSLLLDKTISEAFDNAVADVGHSERAPKLLIQSLPLQEIRRSTSLWVVLEHRGKARNRSNKPILGRAKVLPHTAVNGWVRVEVGGRAMAWRVGHWRLIGQAEADPGPALVVPRQGDRRSPAGSAMAVVHMAAAASKVLTASSARPSLKRSLALDSLSCLLEQQARPKRQMLKRCKALESLSLLLEQPARSKRQMWIARRTPRPCGFLLEEPLTRRPKLKRSLALASLSFFLLQQHPKRPVLRRSRALDCLGTLLRQLYPPREEEAPPRSVRQHRGADRSRL